MLLKDVANISDKHGLAKSILLIMGGLILFFSIHGLYSIFLAPSKRETPTERQSAIDRNNLLIPELEKQANSEHRFFPTFWGKSPDLPKTRKCENPGSCVVCHKEITTCDELHAFECVKCHKGNSLSQEKDIAHKGLIPDPGALDLIEGSCGACHEKEAESVKQSPMALAPRMINHTRFAWGAQKGSEYRYGTANEAGLRIIPLAEESGFLVDDLLRRSCLRCHLLTEGSSRPGEIRGKGCSACHTLRDNSARKRPVFHGIVRNIGPTACLKCHNANHVGCDFVGLYEKDFSRGFTYPVVNGKQPPRIYGAEQHRLTPDLHYKAGMGCSDCHSLSQIHGGAWKKSGSRAERNPSCRGCHVQGNSSKIVTVQGNPGLLINGDIKEIPKWPPEIIPHAIGEHKRLKCSSCHALWSFQDYGLHLMLEERAAYWKWSTLAGQNDPQVQQLLREMVGTYAELIPPKDGPYPHKPYEKWIKPKSKDWLTGKHDSGAWFRSLTARRWENGPIGLDTNGKVSIMRPIYQYIVTHVDSKSRLLKNSEVPLTGSGKPALVFNPYSPHTIASKGRACHDCHANTKAVGLGLGVMGISKPKPMLIWPPEVEVDGPSIKWDALLDISLSPIQFSTHKNAGPLDRVTARNLLNPTMKHRVQWAKYLHNSQLKLDTGSGGE